MEASNQRGMSHLFDGLLQINNRRNFKKFYSNFDSFGHGVPANKRETWETGPEGLGGARWTALP